MSQNNFFLLLRVVMALFSRECAICLVEISKNEPHLIDFCSMRIQEGFLERRLKEDEIISLSRANLEKIEWVNPCRHRFHAACITKALESQSKCPFCRFDLKDVARRVKISGEDILASANLAASDDNGFSDQLQDQYIQMAGITSALPHLLSSFQLEIVPNHWNDCFLRAVAKGNISYVKLALRHYHFDDISLGKAMLSALNFYKQEIACLIVEKSHLSCKDLSQAIVSAMGRSQLDFAHTLLVHHGIDYLSKEDRGFVLKQGAFFNVRYFCDQALLRGISETDRREACLLALDNNNFDLAKDILRHGSYSSKKGLGEILCKALEKDCDEIIKMIVSNYEVAEGQRQKAFCLALKNRKTNDVLDILLQKKEFSLRAKTYLFLLCLNNNQLGFSFFFFMKGIDPLFRTRVLRSVIQSKHFHFFDDSPEFHEFLALELPKKKHNTDILFLALEHERHSVLDHFLKHKYFSARTIYSFKKELVKKRDKALFNRYKKILDLDIQIRKELPENLMNTA